MSCFWIFFHDWECTDKTPDTMMPKEARYWHIEVCRKCGAEREALSI